MLQYIEFGGDAMKTIEELEIFAKDNYVPIARRDVVAFLSKLIKDNNYKSILEIGTAIGYTSISLALVSKDIRITTVEKNIEMFKIANQNFLDFNVNKQIRNIHEDAILFYPDKKYDLIFIDASKKRNKYFFERFSKSLLPNGTIIIDNMNLEDLWVDAVQKKKDKYQKVNEDFIEYLHSLEDYDVDVRYDVGDGIAIVRRKENV
jgi:predicted O-methyltransferase YrrM